MAVLNWDKVDITEKKLTEKKNLTERDIIQYITIKESIHKEDLPILNVLPLTTER